MIEGPTETKLKELIGFALGEVSVSWDPIPTGTFDSTKASKILDRVTCDVMRIIADLMDPRTHA